MKLTSIAVYMLHLALFACGTNTDSQTKEDDYSDREFSLVIESRELSAGEVRALGIKTRGDLDSSRSDDVSKAGSVTSAISLVSLNFSLTGADVVNELAGRVFEVLTENVEDRQNLNPVVLGSALPSGVDVVELTGRGAKSKVFKKTVVAVIAGVATRIKLADHVYEITYGYDRAYKGKGHYITNLSYIPHSTDVFSAPLFGVTFSASAVSAEAENIGTDAAPVGSLALTINFTCSSRFETKSRSDRFNIEGLSGEMTESRTPFNGSGDE